MTEADERAFSRRARELLTSVVECAEAGAFGKNFIRLEDGYYGDGCPRDCACVICECRALLAKGESDG